MPATWQVEHGWSHLSNSFRRPSPPVSHRHNIHAATPSWPLCLKRLVSCTNSVAELVHFFTSGNFFSVIPGSQVAWVLVWIKGHTCNSSSCLPWFKTPSFPRQNSPYLSAVGSAQASLPSHVLSFLSILFCHTPLDIKSSPEEHVAHTSFSKASAFLVCSNSVLHNSFSKMSCNTQINGQPTSATDCSLPLLHFLCSPFWIGYRTTP